MSGVFQLMSQQFPNMFKSPPGENQGSAQARLVGAGGQKVVCTPEVSLYQYTTPEMQQAPLPGGGQQQATSGTNPLSRIMEDKALEQGPGTEGLQTGNGFQCGFCGKTFQQKNTFQNHLRSHREGDDPYQCDICGKTFAVPARLTRHYRTHTGEKPYQCEYCNKSFSVKENLSVHRRIHTKERPYKCEVCERAFEHSGKLHRHMRIHTGERPHRCQICQKTFIQSGQLVIHMRTHTGEKPYVCKVCGKGFTCSKQLKVHTRTHTGEKPYTCDICGKSFGYNHVLKLHQVAHYGEKVYKCTLCNGTFNSKKALETHIKTHSEDHVPPGPASPITEPGVLSPASLSQVTPQSQNSDKENRECSDSELSSQNSPSSQDGPKTPPSPPMLYSSAPSSAASGSSHHHHHHHPHHHGGEHKLHHGTTTVSGGNIRSANVIGGSPFNSDSMGKSNNNSSNNVSNNNNNSSQDKTCSSLPIPYPMLPPGVQIQQAPHGRTTFLYVTSKLPPHPALNNTNNSSSSLSESPPPVSPPVIRQAHVSPQPAGFAGLTNNNTNKGYAVGGGGQKGVGNGSSGNGGGSIEVGSNGRDKMLMYSSMLSERVLAFTKQYGYGIGEQEEQQNAQNSKRFIENAGRYRESSSSSGVSLHPIMVPENLQTGNKAGYGDVERERTSGYHQSRLRHLQQQLGRERSSSPEIIQESSRQSTTSYAPGGMLAIALTKGSKAAVNLAAAAATHNIPAKVSLIPVNMSNNQGQTMFSGYSQSRLSPRSSSPGSPVDFRQHQQLYSSSAHSPGNRGMMHSPSPNSTPRSTPSLQEDCEEPLMHRATGELSSDENSSTSSNASSSVGTKRARSPNNSSGGPRKRSSLILEKYAMENPASPAPPSSESILSQRLRLSSVIQYAEKCS